METSHDFTIDINQSIYQLHIYVSFYGKETRYDFRLTTEIDSVHIVIRQEANIGYFPFSSLTDVCQELIKTLISFERELNTFSENQEIVLIKLKQILTSNGIELTIKTNDNQSKY